MWLAPGPSPSLTPAPLITHPQANAARAAIDGLNNTDFGGRTIRVNEAAPPGEGGGGRRGGE